MKYQSWDFQNKNKIRKWKQDLLKAFFLRHKIPKENRYWLSLPGWSAVLELWLGRESLFLPEKMCLVEGDKGEYARLINQISTPLSGSHNVWGEMLDVINQDSPEQYCGVDLDWCCPGNWGALNPLFLLGEKNKLYKNGIVFINLLKGREQPGEVRFVVAHDRKLAKVLNLDDIGDHVVDEEADRYREKFVPRFIPRVMTKHGYNFRLLDSIQEYRNAKEKPYMLQMAFEFNKLNMEKKKDRLSLVAFKAVQANTKINKIKKHTLEDAVAVVGS